jgi:hypothetical protein
VRSYEVEVCVPLQRPYVVQVLLRVRHHVT